MFLSISLSVYYLLAYLSATRCNRSVYLSIHLFACLHICVPSVSVCLCLTICLQGTKYFEKEAKHLLYYILFSFIFVLLILELFKAGAESSSTAQPHPSAQRKLFVELLRSGHAPFLFTWGLLPKKIKLEKKLVEEIIGESHCECLGVFSGFIRP